MQQIESHNEFFYKQRDSLVREFRDNMCYCLIATTEKKLRIHSLRNNWECLELTGIQKPNTAWVVKKGNIILPQLWVNSKYRGWRTAFRKFLNEHFSLLNRKIPENWHVDHLLPKSRFSNDAPEYLIRLYLLKGSINMSYGAGYEKSFYQQERTKEPKGGFHMDWISFLKAYGFKLPSKTLKSVNWSRWAWNVAEKLEKKGVEEQLFAYHGISTLINLGYTGNYSSLPLPSDLFALAKEMPNFRCMPSLRELK